uniref:Protein kinase n=1 Tax=Schistosoma mansoni TaxID=6183 RepID=A0A3Q0KFS2_SCHMA
MTKICSSNKYKLQIKQALDGNFIVLYQPAPNSFIIIQKNEGITHNKIDHNIHQESEHHDNLNSSSINTNDCQSKYHSRRQRRQRFRVVIGPQLCNCQNEIMRETGMIIKLTEPCVHLLFVMLHVLKIPSDDPHLSAIPLPSSKAEFWIEKYQNHRHSLVQSYNKNRRNSNTLKNEGNQSETLKFSEKLINSEMSNTRLIIPQPIRHEKTSNFLHLRALMNPSAYDSSELSSITQDIVPVSRRETESAGTCDPSTSCTTATSRTSSIDSIESCKLDSSCRSNDQHCRPRQPTTFSCSSNSETALSCRRPQTAPQPELPPRLGRTRAKFVRHSASSTTFRPVRDCSPLIIREGCLTPIESEENSTNNSLKYRTPMTSMNKNTTTIYTDNYDKLQEPLITTIPAITNKLSHSTTASDLLHGPTPRSNFTHARRSSFKPTTPMKQKFSFHNTPINLPLITNNQTSTTVNHVNTFNSTPASKQHICPPSLQQQTSVHVTGTAITSTNNTTVLDESAKICNLCLRNCHVETTINSSNHNGNNLIVDSGGNINLIDPILVCQSVLPDYDDDSNDSGINNEKKATFICGAIFHTSCCKIWLEEIQSDGDSPQCPVCGCVWIHIPSFDSHAKCDKFDEFDKNSDHTKCICCLSSSEQINNQQTDNNNDQQMKNNQQDDQHQSCHKYHNQNNEQQQMNETLRFTYQPVNLNADLNLTENMTVVKTLLPDPPFSEYNSCVSAFSVEIANGLISCDWTVRQYALQKATHLTISQVILARQCNLHSSHNNLVCSLNHHDGNCATPAKCQLYTGPDYVKIMFKLIQFLLDDPVDAIFTDALRAFRELLGYLVAYNKETQTVLQKAIGPILRRLLRFVGGQSNLWNLRNPESFLPLATHQQNDDENKTITNCNPTNNNSSYLAGKKSVNCQLNVKIDENNLTKATNELSVTLPKIPADANFRDRCNLALATLIELAKGQSGALAIGREVHSASRCLPVSGIQHMVRFVLSSAKFHATHLIGRLTVVDKLIRMHQTRRILLMQQQPQRQESLLLSSDLSIKNNPDNNNNINNNNNSTDISSSMDKSSSVVKDETNSLSSQTTTLSLTDQSLARRHLCSTIIFARRHLLPLYPKPDNMTMCFPYHYQLQSTDTHCGDFFSRLPPSSLSSAMRTIKATTTTADQHQHQNELNNVDYYHYTQYKANRIARRVFLTAARALLTWQSEKIFDRYDPIPPSTFNANSFIESEINRLDAPLATWFRNRLCLLLYSSNETSNVHRITKNNSWNILLSNHLPTDVKQSYATPSNTEALALSSTSPYITCPTYNKNISKVEKSNGMDDVNSSKDISSQQQRYEQKGAHNSLHSLGEELSFNNASSSSIKIPPIPPPRRLTISNSELVNDYKKDSTRSEKDNSINGPAAIVNNGDDNDDDDDDDNESENTRKIKAQILKSSFARIALEPAYDLVALSESGNYSSVSEFEDDEDEDDDDENGRQEQQQQQQSYLNEPIYTGRSLGSEADLQCEQVTVLRNALTRSTHQLKPLLPIPGLSFVMSSFQQTKKLPNSDEYYESVDWIRGPILGHGAFSQCYQARDVRTGLLLAVKRIRLGRNGMFSLFSSEKNKAYPSQINQQNNHENEPNCNNNNDNNNSNNNGQQNPIYHRPLSPTSLNQLAEVETEVRIMLQLDHPNILRLFGAVHCVKRGFVDLFIEWMPGGSITSLLQQYGAFNESITLNYGIQLIRGLAYLHKHGILHRDLKGANLLIDSTGTVIKISDFGASARLSGEQSVAGQFQGQVIGTFSFMAPEVLRGETYGRACDIWSVGCCLVEMLTSKPPWHDARLTNRFALMFTIATSNSPPTYPKDLTTDLIAVLDACFARNPSDRPTANQLLTYNVFARLISQQQSVTALEQGKQASILSSVSTSPNAMKTLKNTDKSVKCQINSMKSSTKSSFSYQRLFKTFQSSKISSTMNDKKVIVVEEAENEESDDDGEGCVGNFESDSTALATSTHLKHIQHHSDKHRLQKQHNQHLDDSGLLTRRRKTRRPTLPPLNFRRKYHPHTPVVSPSFK